MDLCLSVISRSSIETAERIELTFGLGASLHLSYTVFKKFGYLQNKGTSLRNFVPNSRHKKSCFGISIVETCYRHCGRSACDKVDRRRSTRRRSNKLKIAPSSDSRLLQFITVIIKLCLQHDRVGLLATADTCYTLCLKKKQDTKLLPITSPNVDRFSKFFHWQTHW